VFGGFLCEHHILELCVASCERRDRFGGGLWFGGDEQELEIDKGEAIGCAPLVSHVFHDGRFDRNGLYGMGGEWEILWGAQRGMEGSAQVCARVCAYCTAFIGGPHRPLGADRVLFRVQRAPR